MCVCGGLDNLMDVTVTGNNMLSSLRVRQTYQNNMDMILFGLLSDPTLKVVLLKEPV